MTDEEKYESCMKAGVELFNRGMLREAAKKINGALRVRPQAKEALMLRAKCWAMLGQWKRSVEDLTAVIGLDPSDPDAWLLRGVARFEADEKPRAAILDVSQAIKLDPDNAEAYYHRAMMRRVFKESTEALIDLNRAISLGGEIAPIALFGRATLWLSEAKYKNCRNDVEAAIKLNPKLSPAYVLSGDLHLKMNETCEALRDFTEALRIEDCQPEVYGMRGEILLEKGEFNEALHDYAEMACQLPASPIAQCGIGWSLLGMGDAEGAENHFRKSVELDERWAEGHLGLGLCLGDKDDLDGALRELNKAIDIDPKRPNQYLERGNIYFEREEYHSAADDFTRAATLGPFEPVYHVATARAQLKLGRAKDALESAERALWCNSNLSTAYDAKGDALAALGKKDEAACAYEKFLELSRHDESKKIVEAKMTALKGETK